MPRCSYLGGLALALALLTGCPRREPTPPPTLPEPPTLPSTPAPTPPPPPTPAPTPYVPNKRLSVGRIFNGLKLRTTLETEYGTQASAEREEPDAYTAEVQVRVRVPKPYQDLAGLAKINPQLPAVLPALPTLLETAKISPAFDELYRLKVTALQQSLQQLDGLLTRHNFFDCETVLELEHPATKRKALLMQADMDTDTDGSDSDRVPEIDGSSVTFQPFTSYRWAKKTAQPNSFIPPREARVKQLQGEAAAGALSPARLAENKATQKRLADEISDLRKYSFLVGSTDPYVVLPGSMFGPRHKSAFAANVGDFCVVIYGDRLFPAVVGDVGPPNLIGESSLRICREIYAKSDANNRAVSDLKVTYLLFPSSAERPFAPPNLEQWQARCEKLLAELGGHGGQMMVWEDLTKPKPPPATPVPATPAPATTPAASPGPGPVGASPAPVSSASPTSPSVAATPAVTPTPSKLTPAPKRSQEAR